jgi:hypothetical protein
MVESESESQSGSSLNMRIASMDPYTFLGPLRASKGSLIDLSPAARLATTPSVRK